MGLNNTGVHELIVVSTCSALHCRLGLSVLLFFLSHHVLCSTAYSERIPYTFCRTLMREWPTRTSPHTQKNPTQESVCVYICAMRDSNPQFQLIFFLFITAITQQQPVTVYQVPTYSPQVINAQTYVQPPYPGFIYSPGKYQVILVWQSSMSRLA